MALMALMVLMLLLLLLLLLLPPLGLLLVLMLLRPRPRPRLWLLAVATKSPEIARISARAGLCAGHCSAGRCDPGAASARGVDRGGAAAR